MNSGGYPAHVAAVAFHIGSLPIHTYALTMLLGIIASIASVAYFWHREKYSWELLELMVIIVIPVAIIGARIWFIFGALGTGNITASNWYKIWDGGLAIEGGVSFSAAAGGVVVYFNRHQVDWRKVVSIIIPSILIGQAIGRWGNFANHEVFGRPTSYESVKWLGHWISSNMLIYKDTDIYPEYRVPLFFYESLTSIVGYALLLWAFQYPLEKWIKPGVAGAAYFAWYGLIRAIMEPFRDESDILYWGALPTSVFYSVIYFVFGVSGIVWLQFGTKIYKFNDKSEKWIRQKEIAKRRFNLTDVKK